MNKIQIDLTGREIDLIRHTLLEKADKATTSKTVSKEIDDLRSKLSLAILDSVK